MNRIKLGMIIVVLLTGLTVFSGIMFTRQYRDAKISNENFEALEEMVGEVPESTEPSEKVEDELEELTEEQQSVADVTGDNKFDYSDALLILRRSIGLE